MKKPYIKKYKTINDHDIWIVDGKYIRDNINEEFNNFGLNSRFRFIPRKELWIDKEYGNPNEIKYYIKNLLKEVELMEDGMDYDSAFDKADKFERSYRLKHEKKYDKKTLIKKIHLNLLKKYSKKIKVYIVNGRLVRDYLFIDFTEGGHDFVYDFVPKNELWLDYDIRRTERDFVLLHELYERNLMKKGIKYEHAHKSVSTIEHFCRKNPKILQEKINEEIKKI